VTVDRNFRSQLVAIRSIMEAAMPQPIRVTSPIDPMELRIKRLQIPKARQKKLRAMMAESRARMASLDAMLNSALRGGVGADDANQQGKKLHSAFPAC
jgi:hypothetical protein